MLRIGGLLDGEDDSNRLDLLTSSAPSIVPGILDGINSTTLSITHILIQIKSRSYTTGQAEDDNTSH